MTQEHDFKAIQARFTASRVHLRGHALSFRDLDAIEYALQSQIDAKPVDDAAQAEPTDAEVREAFERDYSCGDPLIDGESLARNSDGTYETALARLCFKWFGKGRALQSKGRG